MNRRIIKQLIYGIFFLLIWALIGFGAYYFFLKSESSCFDNRQNQNEAGVDCGGVCTSCEFKNAKFLEIQSIKTFPVDVTSVAVFQIKNPNTNLAAEKFIYTLRIFGDLDIELKTVREESFIYGGEIKYIIEPDLGFKISKIKNIKLELDPNIKWQIAEKLKKPKFEIKNSETKFLEDDLEITGRIENQEPINFKNTIINVLIRDVGRNILAATRTVVPEWSAFEEKDFLVTYPVGVGLEKVEPSLTQIFVEAKE